MILLERAFLRRGCALVWLSVLVLGCHSLTTSVCGLYLEEVTGKATQEEVMQKWGPPKERRLLDIGESVWSYRFTSFSSMQSRMACEGYELRFDFQKVLKQWNHIYC